ncbi:MAG: hypothetical protein V4858_10370 [Pseudomonadota bacterium]
MKLALDNGENGAVAVVQSFDLLTDADHVFFAICYLLFAICYLLSA